MRRRAVPGVRRAILKPDVVFFEEMLPEAAIDRAYELAERARLLLVVGSSLEVLAGGGAPDVTRRAGGQVAIVNLGPTASTELRSRSGARASLERVRLLRPVVLEDVVRLLR